MNLSNVVHGIFAVIFQLILFVLTKNPWYGVCLTALFWGREHAQKQYNIARQRMCTVKELAAWEGADMTKWSTDSLLDFLIPLVSTLVMAKILLDI